MPSPDGNGHASAPGTVLITGGAGFVGSHLENRDELRGRAFNMGGGPGTFPLITHSVPLAELGRAFDLMRERPGGFMKAVVGP